MFDREIHCWLPDPETGVVAAFEYSSVNDCTLAVVLLSVTSTVLVGSADQFALRLQGDATVPAPTIVAEVVFCRTMLAAAKPEVPRASE